MQESPLPIVPVPIVPVPTAPSSGPDPPGGDNMDPTGGDDPVPVQPTEKELKSECNLLAVKYFCREQPMRDPVANKAWVDGVIDGMAMRYGGSTPGTLFTSDNRN